MTFGGLWANGGNKALFENGLFPMTTADAAPLAKKSLFWPPTDSVNRIPRTSMCWLVAAVHDLPNPGQSERGGQRQRTQRGGV